MTHVYPFTDEGSDRIRSQVFDKRAATEAPSTAAGGATAAEDVTIADAGGYFTGTDVEAALQELGAAGGGSGESITKAYTQAAHGFAVGDAVYLGGSGWALADRDAHASVADGVVSAVADADNFTITQAGLMTATEAQWDNATGEGALDVHLANVVALLHMNGSNGSTTCTDSANTPKTYTAVASAQISTAQSKFGGASALFDGNADSFTTPNSADFNFGTGDFTVEGWLRPASTGTQRAVIGTYQDASNGWLIQVLTDKLVCNLSGDGADLTGTTSLAANTWYHFAVSRSGTDARLFINGTIEASATDSTNITSTATLNVAGFPGFAANCFHGYLDDIRITKGVARYTANFTAPTSAYPDSTTVATGLGAGNRYFLSSTPGMITSTRPVTGRCQAILKAESATVARVAIGQAQDL